MCSDAEFKTRAFVEARSMDLFGECIMCEDGGYSALTDNGQCWRCYKPIIKRKKV